MGMTVVAGWGPVADAFAATVASPLEPGGALVVRAGGRVVVDVWAGAADARAGRAWGPDTPVLVMSTTKAFTGACALHLMASGRVGAQTPVARVWPGFLAPATVGDLLCHAAGLPGWSVELEPVELADWGYCCGLLAAQEPWWAPGTAVGYHARTYGYLVGEVVRRVDGRTLGRYLAEEVAGPAGAEVWVGAPADVIARAARLVDWVGPPGPGGAGAPGDEALGPLGDRVFFNPAMSPAAWGQRALLAAEVPAVNGLATARGLAGLYDAVARGGLVPAGLLGEAVRPHADGFDLCIGRPARYGWGFALHSACDPLGGAGTFGYAGSGGSLGYAWPEAGVSVGYVTAGFRDAPGEDPRRAAIVAAVRDVAARLA